jgi:hypothetical protein
MTESLNSLGQTLANISDRVTREIELSDKAREAVLQSFATIKANLESMESAITDEMQARRDSLAELLNGVERV